MRTYSFLASVLPYTNAEWEKLSIFLNFLVPKLPAPAEEDLSKGILETIDMDSYRVEKKAAMQIAAARCGRRDSSRCRRRAAATRLSRNWTVSRTSSRRSTTSSAISLGLTPTVVHQLITQEIPARVAADIAYQNARKNDDKQNARIEHDKALERVMTAVLKDDTELFKQFMDNESFKRWLTDTVFGLTYGRSEAGGLTAGR